MNAAISSDLTVQFAHAMDRLGPFEPRPRIAVAVSGGADSMALAWLARNWVSERGGEVLAFTVDHGLRPESSKEAAVTLLRLADLGIGGRQLTVCDLVRGPGLAERAREARYRLLFDACALAGIPHLILGHHRGDQVETVMMRTLSGSMSRGLAGMPVLSEARQIRLLRPLLDFAPGQLRSLLTQFGIAWVEDPSNSDPAALRTRLRDARADASGSSAGTVAVATASRQAGEHRAARDRMIAMTLAERVAIRPEGYAVITPGPIDPEALAALLRTIGGAPHMPAMERVVSLARALRPATLGGVRIMRAGRLGPGWLLIREPRAMEPPVTAFPNAIWDGRFRLAAWPSDGFTLGLTIGALGGDAARFRDRNGPPAAVLHGLPALRLGEKPIAVPHIGFGDASWRFLFDPRNSAAGAPFAVGAMPCGGVT
jgi:tRNA(Ile)-lysidine synthase